MMGFWKRDEKTIESLEEDQICDKETRRGGEAKRKRELRFGGIEVEKEEIEGIVEAREVLESSN
jgi:hypothetical protein